MLICKLNGDYQMKLLLQKLNPRNLAQHLYPRNLAHHPRHSRHLPPCTQQCKVHTLHHINSFFKVGIRRDNLQPEPVQLWSWTSTFHYLHSYLRSIIHPSFFVFPYLNSLTLHSSDQDTSSWVVFVAGDGTGQFARKVSLQDLHQASTSRTVDSWCLAPASGE